MNRKFNSIFFFKFIFIIIMWQKPEVKYDNFYSTIKVEKKIKICIFDHHYFIRTGLSGKYVDG